MGNKYGKGVDMSEAFSLDINPGRSRVKEFICELKYRSGIIRDEVTPEDILRAYSEGWFPMAKNKEDKDLQWYFPRKRGIIPIGEFHAGKNCKRLVKQQRFTVSVNTRFREVVESCADHDWSWISHTITELYCELHKMGFAHSVEILDTDNKLIGGQFGVALKGAYLGMSLFNREKNIEKVALYYTHEILRKNNFQLWDHMWYTEHLGRMGCIEISKPDFKDRLNEALKFDASFEFQQE